MLAPSMVRQKRISCDAGEGRARFGRVRAGVSLVLDLHFGRELIADAANRAQQALVADRLAREAGEPLERALGHHRIGP